MGIKELKKAIQEKFKPLADLWFRLNKPLRYGIVCAVTVLILARMIVPIFGGLSAGKVHRIGVDIYEPAFQFDQNGSLDTLVFEFSQSVVKIDDVALLVDQSLIKMKPAIEGTWSWVSQDELAFKPKTSWEYNTSYEIQFNPKIFNENIVPERFQFRFTTPTFSLDIDSLEFIIDASDESKKYLVGDIETNFLVSAAQLSDLAVFRVLSSDREDTFFTKNKKINGRIVYDEDTASYRVISEPLPVPYGKTEFELAVAGTVLSSRVDASRTVSVAGRSDAARIVGVELTNVENDDGSFTQTLVVETSTAIRAADILSHLTVKVWEDVRRMSGAEENKIFADLPAIELRPSKATIPVSKVNGYVLNAKPGSKMRVEIKSGATLYGGYILNKPYSDSFTVRGFSNTVRFQGSGTILSSVGEKKLSASAIGYSSVYAEVSRIRDDQVQHLASQTSGDFINLDFNGYGFNERNISLVYGEEIRLGGAKSFGTPVYFSIDLDRYLRLSSSMQSKFGLFVVSVYNSKENRSLLSKKFVMISDMGIIRKVHTDGSSDIFVQSFSTGRPVLNVTIDVLGANGVSLIKKVTDQIGRVTVPPLGDFVREQAPVLITAQNASDYTAMKLNAGSNRLSFSNFSVGGRDENRMDEAFVFFDRDIYRPGETMTFGTIIKNRNWDSAVAGNVYQTIITNAEGAQAYSTEWRPGPEGLAEFSYDISTAARTGYWTVSVYRKMSYGPEQLAVKQVRVDEFLPDTLRAEIRIDGADAADLWTPLETLSGSVQVNQLNGFPAVGNTVRVTRTLSPASIQIPQFRQYSFSMPRLNSRLDEESQVKALQSDEKGRADFSFDLSSYKADTFKLEVNAAILEKEGGRGIRRIKTLTVSSVPYLVGVERVSSLFLRNSTARILFIAVNNKGNKIAAGGLRYQLHEKAVHTQLVKNGDGPYEYKTVSQMVETELKDAVFTEDGFTYTVNTARGGDYRLSIIDSAGNVLAEKYFTVEGGQNLSVARGKTSDLEISLLSPDVASGEEVLFVLKSPFTGNALVTIERDRVYAAKWVRVNEQNGRYSITLPSGIDGNAFLNVILLRDYRSADVYTSPVSIGVSNFSINRAARENPITLSVAAEKLPGTTLPITYRTAEKSKIILYGVDEGILLFTGYETPDPLSLFFEQRRLQVSTYQNIDLFLPEYSLLRRASADIGADYEMSLAAGLNPFGRQVKKPVVFWSGILDASPEEQVYEYTIPDYFNGTLKIFAVAVSKDKIGVTESSTIIRDKIVLIPTVPLKAFPGDEINASVRVINDTGSADNFTLKIDMPAGYTLVKNEPLQFALENGKEQTVRFTFKPSQTYGAFDFTFTATAQKTGFVKTSRENMSVRPFMPYLKERQETVVRPGKNTSFTHGRTVQKDLAKTALDLSYDPFGLVSMHMEFLDDYSYDCSEQLMSRVLGKVVMVDNPNVPLDRKKVQNELNEVSNQLMLRINSSNLLGMWTPDSDDFGFLDTYLALLVNMSQQKKLTMPQSLIDANFEALVNFVSIEDFTSEADIRRQCQVAYLLAERGWNSSSVVEFLMDKIERRELNWKNDIASAYLASALKILHADEQAELLMADVSRKLTVSGTSGLYENQTVYRSQLLYLLSAYFAGERFNGSIKRLSGEVTAENSSVTVNSAFMIYGMSRLLQVNKEFSREVTISVTGADGKTSEQNVTLGPELKHIALDPTVRSVKVINADRELPLYATFRSAGYDENRKMPTDNQGLDIVRLITDKSGEKVKTAKVGDELVIRLRVQAKKKNLYNLAVIDLLPACFEHDLGKKVTIDDETEQYGQFTDRREDRLIAFIDAPSGRVVEVTYHVKVIASGLFTLPPVFSENLYVNNSLTLTQKETFTVSNE